MTTPRTTLTTLHAGYDAMKAVDSNAVVLLGGLAYDGFNTDPAGPFVESFLDNILTDGAANYFDVMNFHYYPWYDWRWEGLTGEPGMIGKTHEIQDVLASHSVTKPIVCTELGDSSGGQYPSDTRTEDTQAIAVIEQFTRAVAAGNKIGIWFNMNDYPDPYGFGENGLLDYPSFDPKLSLDAYENSSHTLARVRVCAHARQHRTRRHGSGRVSLSEFFRRRRDAHPMVRRWFVSDHHPAQRRHLGGGQVQCCRQP